jgi:integrase
VKIDKLLLDDTLTPEAFGESMRLLKTYLQTQANGPNLHAYEELGLSPDEDGYSNITRGDEWLLAKAINLTSHLQKELDQLSEERTFLKKIVDGGVVGQSVEGEALKEIIQDSISPKVPDAENPPLRQCQQEWLENNPSGSLVRAVELFCRFMEETKAPGLRLNDLEPVDIRQYQKFSVGLPKGVAIKEDTIEDLIKLSGASRSVKTLLDEFSYIATFLNWCTSQGYVFDQRIPAVLTKGSGLKKGPEDQKPRLPLTDEDLSAFFNGHLYRDPTSFKTSGMYWGPILAVFTGARMSELLSLEKHNLKRLETIWYLDILDHDPDSSDKLKRVKASGSVRTVPLHSQLIDLGFVEYAQACSGRLFPDEPRNAAGKFDAFQKRQRRWREKIGIKPPHKNSLKDFHSFRHTVRTRLDELKTEGRVATHFNDGVIDAIVGHESGERSIGQRVYTHGDNMKTKAMALKKLCYDSVDWRSVPRWDKTSFSRSLRRQGLLKK